MKSFDEKSFFQSFDEHDLSKTLVRIFNLGKMSNIKKFWVLFLFGCADVEIWTLNWLNKSGTKRRMSIVDIFYVRILIFFT